MADEKTSGHVKDAKAVKKAEKPAKKVEAKPAAKEKKAPSYKISRSPEAKKLAKEKSRLEKKKGKFKRPNLGRVKKVKNRWRRTTGIDSGQRQGEKDKPPMPNAGYMTPPKLKGLLKTGYWPIRVFNVAGLSAIEQKTQAILIASQVGRKKRLEIQKAAKEKGIQILNYKE